MYYTRIYYNILHYSGEGDRRHEVERRSTASYSISYSMSCIAYIIISSIIINSSVIIVSLVLLV